MTQHNDDDQRMVRLQEGEGCAFEEIVAASKTNEHMLRIQKALEAKTPQRSVEKTQRIDGGFTDNPIRI